MALTSRKVIQVLVGTTLIGTGVALNFSSNLGLGPWGVFHEGISLNTSLTFGNAIIATGIFVTLLWIPLWECNHSYRHFCNTSMDTIKTKTWNCNPC